MGWADHVSDRAGQIYTVNLSLRYITSVFSGHYVYVLRMIIMGDAQIPVSKVTVTKFKEPAMGTPVI